MDEEHLVVALRYVSLNPVRARLVDRVEDWPGSSVRAHLAGRDDEVVTVARALDRVGRFADFLAVDIDEEAVFAPPRPAEKIGRPHGAPAWIARLRQDLARQLAARKRGPKARVSSTAAEEDLFSKPS